MLNILRLIILIGLINLYGHLIKAEEVSSAQLRDLDTHHPFSPPTSLESWEARSRDLRLQIKVSLGLHPLPSLPPVRPRVYGKIMRDHYSIEKVTFESLPGMVVTGNLYRPLGIHVRRLLPAVLSPHGHWDEARFYNAPPKKVKSLLATGQERFESAARNHMQARCVQLARMGCVVFQWDMIGYCDSKQISIDRAHHFSNQPKQSINLDDGWLLYSALAESNAQSVLGLQTLATLRAIEMLLTLPEVDPQRIAITGASGGGTQSFICAAIDDRIRVAFPAVMVGTYMQGGCTCENSCLLRTGTGNVEIAALIAPRPLGMTAANDWTREMPHDGFPELQAVYKLFDEKDKVALFPSLHFGHNFNHVSRVALYGWINDHFNLSIDKPILENDFEIASKDELTVWGANHSQPPGGELFERQLLKSWAGLVENQLNKLLCGGEEQHDLFLNVLKDGWRVCLGMTVSPFDSTPSADLSRRGEIIFTSVNHGRWRISHSASDYESEDHFILIKVGKENVSPNFIYSYSEDDQQLVQYTRMAAAYTYGYNLPVFTKRARQLAATIVWLHEEYPADSITLYAEGASSALAAASAFYVQTFCANPTSRLSLVLDPQNFRFSRIDSIRHPFFLPGSVRYKDFPGLIACLNQELISLPESAQLPAEFELLRNLNSNARKN